MYMEQKKALKRKLFSILRSSFSIFLYLCTAIGGLAQLARALAWHARGHRFEPDILHNPKCREACHEKCLPLVALGTF